MPIPFIFPIAGILLAAGGAGMAARYAHADEAHRNRLDTWLTDGLKAVASVYLKVWHDIDVSSLNPDEQNACWDQFGSHLKTLPAAVERLATEVFGKSYATLTAPEQAEVLRQLAKERGEKSSDINVAGR